MLKTYGVESHDNSDSYMNCIVGFSLMHYINRIVDFCSVCVVDYKQSKSN